MKKREISYQYNGSKDAIRNDSGIKFGAHGGKIAMVVSCDHDTDEDTVAAGKFTRMIIESFMRKPSLDERAFMQIANMANGSLIVGNNRENDRTMCDCAALFALRGQARWVVAGGSKVYFFENGELSKKSGLDNAPAFGAQVDYNVQLEDTVDFTNNENAFLCCSKVFAQNITDEILEETLKDSESPKEWVEKLIDIVGEDKQYCINAAFIPKRKSLFERIFK